WLLARLRRPHLAGFATGVETVGIALAVLFVVRPFTVMLWSWAQERTAWRGLADWWGRVRGKPVLGVVGRWLGGGLPQGYGTAVFLVRLTGLLVACVVFGVHAPRPPQIRPDGIGRHRVGAMAMRPYEPLVLGLRAVRRTAVAPLMAFCLAV